MKGCIQDQYWVVRTHSYAIWSKECTRHLPKDDEHTICRHHFSGKRHIYFDDILIATINDLEVHRTVVSQVLVRLQKLNLYLKPSKCIFDTRRIEFLGVILENGTVMMDPIKVSSVREWKVPTNNPS